MNTSSEPIHNAVSIAEMAIEKGATVLLIPVSARKQLMDLSDDMATKIDMQFFSEPKDALIKALSPWGQIFTIDIPPLPQNLCSFYSVMNH